MGVKEETKITESADKVQCMQCKAGKRKINYKKLLFSVLTMITAVAMFALPAMADNKANEMMVNFINICLTIFKMVGVFLFVWGVIQFILATKRSDADSKADAVQTAMCGIALMVIKSIVTTLGIVGDKGVIQGGTLSDDALSGTTSKGT